jgi:uncharacterized membrane protein YobD (UPF0266 family)
MSKREEEIEKRRRNYLRRKRIDNIVFVGLIVLVIALTVAYYWVAVGVFGAEFVICLNC